MARIMQAAVKNPQVFGAVVGAVIGLIVGLIIDEVFFHLYVRGLVIGFVVGGVLGWWQHKMIAGRAVKLLIGRTAHL